VPSTKLRRTLKVTRLASSVAAMGLVFMGAIVVPVYLVPALAVVLVLGLAAEAWLAHRGLVPRLPHYAGRSRPRSTTTGTNSSR
jgi:hypothetical protein